MINSFPKPSGTCYDPVARLPSGLSEQYIDKANGYEVEARHECLELVKSPRWDALERLDRHPCGMLFCTEHEQQCRVSIHALLCKASLTSTFASKDILGQDLFQGIHSLIIKWTYLQTMAPTNLGQHLEQFLYPVLKG